MGPWGLQLPSLSDCIIFLQKQVRKTDNASSRKQGRVFLFLIKKLLSAHPKVNVGKRNNSLITPSSLIIFPKESVAQIVFCQPDFISGYHNPLLLSDAETISA